MTDYSDRAAAMAEGAPGNLRDRAQELAENILWMEGKLEDARRAIGKSSVAIPYDNGGGQKGIRKNPAFDGYNSLMSTYVRALNALDSLTHQEREKPKATQGALTDLRKQVQRLKVVG